jgi:hypothetical protein
MGFFRLLAMAAPIQNLRVDGIAAPKQELGYSDPSEKSA